MKSHFLLTGLAVWLCSAAGAIASSVTISFTNASKLLSKNGTVLNAGAAVRVGTFTVPGGNTLATLAQTSDLATLKSWFKPLGEGIAGAGTVSQINGSGNIVRVNNFPTAGNVFGSITNISDSYMTPGTPLYIWVFDNAVPDKSNEWGIFTGGTWVVPQPLGVESIASDLSVGAVQGTSVAGSLSLSLPTPSFSNWRIKSFDPGTPAALTANAADPDGDGIPNLAEYAWQLNPAAKDVAPTHVLNSGGPKFRFLSPKTLPDVQVVAEVSTDLKTWTTTASTVVSSDPNFDTCECTVPSNTPKCFWRVRVNPITVP